MSIIQWHNQLSARIRACILLFTVLTILDCSTLFDIPISSTFVTSSNLSSWLSYSIIGLGFIDSFAFHLVSIHFMLIILLMGALKAPFRNIWTIQFTFYSTAAIIFISNYQLIEPSNSGAVLLNSSFQCIKLIPLFLAYRWTKQLAIPVVI